MIASQIPVSISLESQTRKNQKEAGFLGFLGFWSIFGRIDAWVDALSGSLLTEKSIQTRHQRRSLSQKTKVFIVFFHRCCSKNMSLLA